MNAGRAVLVPLVLLSLAGPARADDENDDGPVAPVPPTPDRRALLHVSANVPRARVVINGEPAGQAPVDVRVLPGIVEISVEAADHEAYERSITVHAGEEIKVRGVLKRLAGVRIHLVLPGSCEMDDASDDAGQECPRRERGPRSHKLSVVDVGRVDCVGLVAAAGREVERQLAHGPWRAAGWGGGGIAEMVQYPLDHRLGVDHCNDAHVAAALRADQYVDAPHAAQQLGPR